MNSIFSVTPYIPAVSYCQETAASFIDKITTFTRNLLKVRTPTEPLLYEDKLPNGKLVSSTKVHYHTPTLEVQEGKQHDSFKDLCLYIASTRDPKSKKTLQNDASSASFSAVNRADLTTESRLSLGLKKLLGLENKTDLEIQKFLEMKSFYKYSSDFNGHSYFDKDGKLVRIESAILSSADRKTDKTQNLSLVTSGGSNLLYTGRPETLKRAKEQALFILSHKQGVPTLEEVAASDKISEQEPKWLKKAKGLTWNAQTKCIEFPYAIYSLMSDSDIANAFYTMTGSWENNEKLFLKKERATLKQFKKSPMLIKDVQGNVFKLQCKPIFFSHGFNAFSTIKGVMGEGSLSPILMKRAWDELKVLLKKNPEKAKAVEPHVKALTRYFKGFAYLSNLELFLHTNMVLAELSGTDETLPLVLHCKSSTDRTGIGAAILAAVRQMKQLGIQIPGNVSELTKDPRFKELFVLNWLPTWHQRSKYSRDIAGISFGSGIAQNPILLDCLPARYLKESDSTLRWFGSGIFSALNATGLWLYQGIKMDLPCALDVIAGDLFLKPKDWLALLRHNYLEYLQPTYYPHLFINDKGNEFRSKAKALSPLQKVELGV